MKKLLILLTAVLLLLSVSVSAETMTAETVLFTSEKSNYSMMIPADYIPVNDTFTDMIKTRIVEGKLPGVSDEQIAGIQEAVGNADLSNLDFILSSNLIGNVNIQVQNFPVPGSMLPLIKEELDEVNIETYTAAGIGVKCITTHDMEEIGNCNWYHLSCTILGRDIEQYIAVDEAGTAYILTFTQIDEADMELVLSTFQYE